MNIHYRYSKTLNVNFYQVVYAILTLSGINIIMLVNFFFVTATAVQWRKTGGLGVEPPAANRFLRFSHKKNTHLSTLFIENGCTVPEVSAVSNRSGKIF